MRWSNDGDPLQAAPGTQSTGAVLWEPEVNRGNAIFSLKHWLITFYIQEWCQCSLNSCIASETLMSYRLPTRAPRWGCKPRQGHLWPSFSSPVVGYKVSLQHWNYSKCCSSSYTSMCLLLKLCCGYWGFLFLKVHQSAGGTWLASFIISVPAMSKKVVLGVSLRAGETSQIRNCCQADPFPQMQPVWSQFVGLAGEFAGLR